MLGTDTDDSQNKDSDPEESFEALLLQDLAEEINSRYGLTDEATAATEQGAQWEANLHEMAHMWTLGRSHFESESSIHAYLHYSEIAEDIGLRRRLTRLSSSDVWRDYNEAETGALTLEVASVFGLPDPGIYKATWTNSRAQKTFGMDFDAWCRFIDALRQTRRIRSLTRQILAEFTALVCLLPE